MKSKNPVATALMAKMKIAVKDRPKARAELLRVLASHKLDPARTRLLGVFIDRYLKLSEAEMKVFEREIAGFAPAERQETMELLMGIEIKAIERGRLEGKQIGLHEGKAEVRYRRLKAERLVPSRVSTLLVPSCRFLGGDTDTEGVAV